MSSPHLQKSLGPAHLWGLAVGLVISGEYFGWSYGWGQAGTLGFLVATVVVAILYTSFIFSFTELTTALPSAGGPFTYGHHAFGPWGGFVAGFATLVEFVFAPPAIAFAVGKYITVVFPSLPAQGLAAAAVVAFGALNMLGVKQTAQFELMVTLLAVVELCLFMGVTAPHFQADHFLNNAWQGGIPGIFAALPFAIWFFLGIEGVAMASEEVINPNRDLPRGYISGIITLVVLALGVMLAAGGVGDWQTLAQIDFPIPRAACRWPWAKTTRGTRPLPALASLAWWPHSTALSLVRPASCLRWPAPGCFRMRSRAPTVSTPRTWPW